VVSLRNADALIDAARSWSLDGCRRFCKTTRNPKIEIGKPGRVQASQGITS